MITPEEKQIIIKALLDKPAGFICITPQQCDKIKQVWDELHAADPDHDYTIMRNGTALRKTLINLNKLSNENHQNGI